MTAKITLDLSRNPADRKVIINDVDVTDHVYSAMVRCEGNELPIVTLELVGDVKLTADGVVIETLPALQQRPEYCDDHECRCHE